MKKLWLTPLQFSAITKMNRFEQKSAQNYDAYAL